VAPLIVAEIVRSMREIAAVENLACVMVEQNAAMALGLCQRGYVIEHGSIVAAGTREELLSNDTLQKTYLAAL
jgi:branched-chain amino acid transport system ATP-binding protein